MGFFTKRRPTPAAPTASAPSSAAEARIRELGGQFLDRARRNKGSLLSAAVWSNDFWSSSSP